ncbi:hypothetical protein [Escherichia coli]|uniref:hypothetical protein n=1 Tax=Escherichia coli TaxID=562 RepID=UPI002036BC86|nr:hypothetical protein [Escherichia coli]
MSPITKEFTKEQLQQIIETDHVQCGEASSLARIALASLEAEAVGEVIEQQSGMMMDGLVISEKPTYRNIKGIHKMKMMPLGTKFYTAPPAPVALPSGYSDFEEIWSSSTHPLTQDDEMKDFAWDIWNACRAAMLQGADGALTNEDTKKMDELVMWIKRLAHSLRKASPDSKLQSDAMDYLSRKGLIGVKDILR